MMEVGHLDLKRQHASIREEVLGLIAEAYDNTAFVGGPAVTRFEEAFAEFAGVEHAVGVANGTEAIKLALKAAGVSPGDEVIVPAFTFIATAGAVLDAGAKPILADVDPATALLSTAAVAELLSERTRAVVPVDLYGMPHDFDGLKAVLEASPSDRPPAIIEDAAQAHGAKLGDRPAGSLGDASSFSFYPTKNLSALGDGGAVTTNDAELADTVRMLADHGRPTDPARRDQHLVLGINSRLDALQAGVLSVKLARLPDWQARRRDIAARYTKALAPRSEVQLQSGPEGAVSAYHLFVLRHPERDVLMKALAEAGVQSRAIYPLALPGYEALERLGVQAGSCPAAEAWAREVLTLPIWPELREDEVEHVLSAVDSCLESLSRAGAS